MRALRMRRATYAPIGFLALALTASLAVAVPLATAPQAQASSPLIVLDNTFEDGTSQGWTPRADETVAPSTATAHAGTRSLAVTGRTRSWEGPVRDLLDVVELGTRYTLSVWVRLAAGEPSTQARLSVERRTDGTPTYDQVVGNTAVTAGGWVNLRGQYTLATDVEFLTTYVETASGTAAFHIDDFLLTAEPSLPIQTDIPPVKDVVDEFPIGAAVGPAQLIGNHAQLLRRHFNSVVAGNAMKWDATQPTEGTFRFTDADRIVAFAQTNNMEVRGHTLVWHQQTPAWVFKDAAGNDMTATPANKALLLSRLEDHIRGVAGHYAGDISAWDVVNEVIDENQSDGMRRSRWFEITGLDYIRTAFRVARQVDPAAKLYINDYNTNVPSKRDKLYNLVAQLKAEGVPVDGVGHQMHVNIDWPSISETEAMLTKFIPLGVDQQITEMDISIYTNNSESFPTPPRDRLLKQAYRYRDLFDLYRRYASEITSVTLWGLADDDTWLDTFPVTRNDAPLLFDERLQAKPAYWGVVDPTKIETTPSPTPTTPPPTTPPPTTPPPTTPPPTTPPPTTPPPTTPPPTTGPPPGTTCQVTYAVAGQWPGGFQGDVRVTVTGAPVSGWTLRWTFGGGQQISQAWNGTHTQTGANVAVTNAAWNGTITPGTPVTVGFLASWTGGNPAPTAFTLNNLPCTIG
ncbi:endo-1,4-beta-xylanase [Polymorphospora rubra]|uniref:endo-1,4-beta-xylanase n=1 Tax=Polymorphospora rubra TaxID=338584 RepID=UPI0031E210EA